MASKSKNSSKTQPDRRTESTGLGIGSRGVATRAMTTKWKELMDSHTNPGGDPLGTVDEFLYNTQKFLDNTEQLPNSHSQGLLTYENEYEEEEERANAEEPEDATTVLHSQPAGVPVTPALQFGDMASLIAMMQQQQMEMHRLHTTTLRQQQAAQEQQQATLLSFIRTERQEEQSRKHELEAVRDAQRIKERELDRRLKETPPLPKMDDSVDIELYLLDFTHHMTDLEVPKIRWMTCFRPLLCTWARQVVDTLEDDDRKDFDKVKVELLRATAADKGSIGHRFVTQKRMTGQKLSQFASEQLRRWKQWTEGMTPMQMGNQVLMELMLESLPNACRNAIRLQSPKDAMELARFAEKFFSERDSNIDDSKWFRGNRSSPGQSQQGERYGSKWKVFTPTQPFEPTKTNPMEENKPLPVQEVRDELKKTVIKCFRCNQPGHMAARCPERAPRVAKVNANSANRHVVMAFIGGTQTPAHLDSGADVSVVPPKLVQEQDYTGEIRDARVVGGILHLPVAKVCIEAGGHSTTMEVLVQDGPPLLGLDLPWFHHLAIQKNKKMLKKEKQWMKRNNRKMNGLLEEDEAMRDDPKPAIKISAVQTRRQAQQEADETAEDDRASAESGATPLELNPLDDSLFGTSREKRTLTRAEKRAQANERMKQLPPANERRLLELDKNQLEEEQHTDATLDDLWSRADRGEDNFSVEKGLLKHRSKDEWGDYHKQIVVPTHFRNELIKLAHGSHLGAHLGSKKTVKKILRNFFWKGLNQDVQQYCRSCEECQRGATRKVTKAPLHPLPVVDQPFRKIAIDIVGPLPRTKRGHKYVLTLMDFCSRYPEAIPLKKTDAGTVAEALCGVFARMGLPDEILSDQGSNFMAALLQRVMEVLEIKMVKSSPYHPQSNGMLERFHATLKAMLKKTATERKEWDMYLPYICFAFRDATHSATGFSPFQLLFGRDVRGPLSLLYDQLSETETGPAKVADYVENLKARLREAWRTAAENDCEAKAESKRQYDKRARVREFKVGDQVMVLTPVLTEKLKDQWSGPYVVEEKVTECTYRVHIPETRKKSKLYHVNGLKKWTSPLQVMSVRYCEDEDRGVEALEEPGVMPYEPPQQGDPVIGDILTEEQSRELKKLLEDNKHNFDMLPGHTEVIQHRIPTRDCNPVFHPPYRIPSAWKEKVREELQGMLGAGIIVPSSSPWTSPLVPVKKKDGGIRLCVDYRRLNSKTEDDRYPMPRVEEILDQLGNAKFITTLDLVKGYYQVSVHPDDREKTAFMAPMGKFHFVRMPFGLKGAPTTFQRLMDVLLGSCSIFARAYIDDIVIFSTNWENHLEHLKIVFKILRKAGLKAKPTKCSFAMNSCSYLGHVVGNGQVEMEAAKTDAVKNFRRPQTKKDIRAFLGLAGYYRRFIADFSTLTASLSDLTKKDMPNRVQWNDRCEESFRRLKEELAYKPVLQCPREDRTFTLHTDASERGVGAVLSQEDVEGRERPIAYFSKKLQPRETRYSAIEKECLGIVSALKHFAVHLVGRQFQIVTDHRALRYLATMSNSNPRLTRWALSVQPFDFTITHRPGITNGNADGLSRQAWSIDEELPIARQAPICVAAREGGGDVGIPQQLLYATGVTQSKRPSQRGDEELSQGERSLVPADACTKGKD